MHAGWYTRKGLGTMLVAGRLCRTNHGVQTAGIPPSGLALISLQRKRFTAALLACSEEISHLLLPCLTCC